jgi:2OG-Fe(II) oxygenase superfamily
MAMVQFVDGRRSLLSLLPAREIGRRFGTAAPFPHVVLDDVLDADAADLLEGYPAPDWPGWDRYRDVYQRGKLICSDIATMPPLTCDLVQELCAPRFLQFLEQVTGISRLLPDPYLEGGGLHMSGPGATLTPHTDFHVYTRLGLYRQVNVLLYLNPGWQQEDGGALELFAADSDFTTPERTIDPVWGRMVIFRTDDRSPHGFTKRVAYDRFRRSIALYYYTAAETEGFSGDTNTYWKTHGESPARSHRARLAAYRTLLTGSRALSMLAHRCNPNLGSKVRPEKSAH